jgi:DHA2 family methylenomycin A resistance protein-like MFS transporter
VLTSAVGWRAIFVVNLPVAAITGLLLMRHAAETERHRHHLDLPGQLLAVATLSLLAGGFIVAGERGWFNLSAVALLGLTALIMPAMSAIAIESASAGRIGLASGVLNAARQTGGVFGVAVLGALLRAGHHGLSLEITFTVVAAAYVIGTALALRGDRDHRRPVTQSDLEEQHTWNS